MSDQRASDTPEYTHAVIALMAKTRGGGCVHEQEEILGPEAFGRLAEEVLRGPIESGNQAEAELRATAIAYEALTGLPADLR